MIFRKKLPKFSSSRHIGFFLIFIVILILSHLEFLKINGSFKGVMSATQDNFMERIATISGTGPILSSGQGSITVGGGFIGAIFGGIFVQLFSYLGTIIVSIVVGIVGAVLLFNISIVDALFAIINIPNPIIHKANINAKTHVFNSIDLSLKAKSILIIPL